MSTTAKELVQWLLHEVPAGHAIHIDEANLALVSVGPDGKYGPTYGLGRLPWCEDCGEPADGTRYFEAIHGSLCPACVRRREVKESDLEKAATMTVIEAQLLDDVWSGKAASVPARSFQDKWVKIMAEKGWVRREECQDRVYYVITDEGKLQLSLAKKQLGHDSWAFWASQEKTNAD